MSVILEALKKSQHQRPNRRAVPIHLKRQSTRLAESTRLLLGVLVVAIIATGLAIFVALRPSPPPIAADGQAGGTHLAGGPEPIGPGQAGASHGAPPPPVVLDSAAGAAPTSTPQSAAAAGERVLTVAARPQHREPLGQADIPTSAPPPATPSTGWIRPEAAFAQPVPQAQPQADIASNEPLGPPPTRALGPGQPPVRPLSTQRSSLGAGLDAHSSDSAEPLELPLVTPFEEVQTPPAEPPAYDAAAIEAVAASPVPRLDELPMAYRHDLPAFSLDVHSYDADDSKRFVLINLTKLREGDYLTPNTSVVDIVSEGVVLDHNGMRFLLPASN
jgi:general secretion pathway protein B